MEQGFEDWWAQVNAQVQARIGVTADDMPDLCFVRDWYEDGMTPSEACADLLEAWVEDGCLPVELIEGGAS